MKKKTFLFMATILFGVFGTIMVSCSKEDPLTESRIVVEEPDLSPLDIWLRENYTTPYNIEVLYQWNEAEVDYNRYLYPPMVDKVKPAMSVVKSIWIDSYTEVGGEDFIKEIAPRQLLLIGGINRNSSGTITLGLAEGGKKITFFNVDYLDTDDLEGPTGITQFIHTIQHEYVHILNQTKPFDSETFLTITPSNYTGQWFNETDAGSQILGYITAYARSNVQEDFAEMVSVFLSHSNQEWNDMIDAIPNQQQGQEKIREKERMMVEYYMDEFGIDLYELQEVTYQNTQEVLNN